MRRRRLIVIGLLFVMGFCFLQELGLAVCEGVPNANNYQDGQCTRYALEKRPDLPWFLGDLGNAGNWDTSAEACGFPVGSVPLVGAIAVFQPEQMGNQYGHVAYVEEVFGDGYRVCESNLPEGSGPRCDRVLQQDPRTRFIYNPNLPPPFPTVVTPNNLQFFDVRDAITIRWRGFLPSGEGYRVKIVGSRYLGKIAGGNDYFGPLTTYLETGWFCSEGSYTIQQGSLPEGLFRIYVASSWGKTGVESGYPENFSAFRIGMCDWPGWNASRSDRAFGLLAEDHYCPADIATPTPTPRATQTGVVPTATNTPRPANTPTSTTIPFGIPRLLSPSDGSSFTSGDRIVLSWDCPGGCAESKCWIEREGEIHDSGWTKNLSWVAPINNYGDAKWKVKARKGDLEESDWTQEWTIHIQATGSIPPRLIDPSKGTIFNYGNQIILKWECRSYECKADLLKNGVYLGSSGWTQNEAGWRLYSNVGCGSFTWRVKGRDQSQRETNWSPTFDFRIVNCPPTATPGPTGTRTMTGTATAIKTLTATRIVTKTGTVSVSRTQTPSPTKTKTSVGSRTQTSTPTRTRTLTRTPTATRTRIVIPTLPPVSALPPILIQTSTPRPTATPRPTPTPLRLKR